MITAALVLGCLAAAAPGRDSELPEAVVLRIEKAAEEAFERSHDGLVLLVAVGDEVVLERGWGSAGDGARRATAESSFRAGALHAPLVAALALQLVDEGELSLDASVAELVPGLGDEMGGVTLHQLLAHTSGLAPLGDYELPEEPDRESMLAMLAGAPLEAEPGSCFVYSAANDLLLGWIVADAAGAPLDEVLIERVFGPLDLADTVYCAESAPLDDRSAAYQEARGDLADAAGSERTSPAAGLCTTGEDLLSLHLALVGGEVVDARTFDRMARPARLESGQPTGHGLGLGRSDLAEQRRITYGGGMAGGHVHCAWYPASDLSIVMLARGAEARLDRLETAVARAVLDLEEPEVSDLPTTEEQRERYTGTFYVGCDQLRIEVEDDELVFDASGWTRTRLMYQGGDTFLGEDSGARFEFELEGDRATAFRLVSGGVEVRATRMN